MFYAVNVMLVVHCELWTLFPFRALEEEQHKHQSEMQNVMMKLSSIQGERKSLSIKMADSEAEKSQMQGEIRAMNRAQK